ncbi:esterase/lipase family protein [Glaciibacter sp. 2TAF33]|uniref:esterase/lipase family protein n=1 Tax=Glaciibacter sp. 2TAF33 TaxID=3233015 RepID=UPI003F92C82A
MTVKRGGQGPLNVLGKAWFWAIDYIYVGYWQVRGSLRGLLRGPRGGGPGGGEAADWSLGGRQPVVLLPGIYETWQFMRPIADALHANGHPLHVVTDLGRNRATVVAAADVVARLLAERDLHDVIIVAHSKGGLIGKYLMAEEATSPGTARIDRMIAVATPFSGSSLARYTVLPSLRAFAPTDATIRQLMNELTVNVRITSIFGSFDPHIPGGSELAGAVNIELPVAGHFRIVGDPQLLRAVVAAAGD